PGYIETLNPTGAPQHGQRAALPSPAMIPIKVPPLGESIVEATVAKWLKNEGDTVAQGETLVELETDKITVEVPAFKAGVLKKRARAGGATVPVDDGLGQTEEPRAPGAVQAIEPPAPAAAPVAAAPAPPPAPAPARASTGAPSAEPKSSPSARREA